MFTRLIMGHKTASAQFSRMIAKLFSDSKFRNFLYFVDDIFISSNTVASHFEKLEYLLKKFSKANLKLSPTKCCLMRNNVKYLGMTIDSRGISIDEDRIKAVKNLQPPKNIRQLQKTLGFFGYMRNFLENYGKISAPMYNLLRKNTKFNWDQNCQSAFEELNDLVTHAPVLSICDYKDPHDSYEVTL